MADPQEVKRNRRIPLSLTYGEWVDVLSGLNLAINPKLVRDMQPSEFAMQSAALARLKAKMIDKIAEATAKRSGS